MTISHITCYDNPNLGSKEGQTYSFVQTNNPIHSTKHETKIGLLLTVIFFLLLGSKYHIIRQRNIPLTSTAWPEAKLQEGCHNVAPSLTGLGQWSRG